MSGSIAHYLREEERKRNEFMDLIAFGSINTIVQVYQSLDKRRERYAPVFRNMFGDATKNMSAIVSTLGGMMINRISTYLDTSLNSNWITFAPENIDTPGGLGPDQNAEMLAKLCEGARQSGVAAKSWNSGMPW